jgi:hypothetical protein
MPGKYYLSLKKETYWIWVFDKWRLMPLAKKTAQRSIQVIVRNSKGIEQKVENSRDEINYSDDQHAGSLLARLEVKDKGVYSFQCTGCKPVLVVVAPSSSIIRDLGSAMIFNDLTSDHFERRDSL